MKGGTSRTGSREEERGSKGMADDERHGPGGTSPGRRHDAEDVRQGEIILRTSRRRAIFIAGLAGIILLPILLRLLAR